ncbi:MAG TPA: HAD family hydrolase [Terriglobales bacterium]|nr:HAD family hydrolase [Terriglobales bacterium]
MSFAAKPRNLTGRRERVPGSDGEAKRFRHVGKDPSFGKARAHLLWWYMAEITCSALLFDLDGVLIDSTPAVTRVWTWWALQHGFNPDEVVKRAHGRPSLATVREYLPQADLELENREVERREIADLDGVVGLPGARELLASLPSARWTIVTSCTRRLAEVRMRAAALPTPEHLVSADDITRGKPDPEPYLRAATLLGFPAKDCVVVEDAPAGVLAGRAAGAKVIAVRTTSADPELVGAGASWIVDGCNAISVLGASSAAAIRLDLENGRPRLKHR